MSSHDNILASIQADLPRLDRQLPHVRLFDDDAPASHLSAFKESLHAARYVRKWAGTGRTAAGHPLLDRGCAL
jgi:hypothetical protein